MNVRQRHGIRTLLISKYGLICHWCASVLDLNAKKNNMLYATIEHLVPVSEGGKTEIGNLRLACRRCNSSRHSPYWDSENCVMLEKSKVNKQHG